MGFFSKLFQGPQPDMEKSNANRQKISQLFFQAVENGSSYRLIVGWNEAAQTIAVLPTVPDLSGYGNPAYYRRDEIYKAYRNK